MLKAYHFNNCWSRFRFYVANAIPHHHHHTLIIIIIIPSVDYSFGPQLNEIWYFSPIATSV